MKSAVQPSVKNLVRDSSVFAGGKKNDWGKVTTTVLEIFKLPQAQEPSKIQAYERKKLQKYWHYSIRMIRKFPAAVHSEKIDRKGKGTLKRIGTSYKFVNPTPSFINTYHLTLIIIIVFNRQIDLPLFCHQEVWEILI